MHRTPTRRRAAAAILLAGLLAVIVAGPAAAAGEVTLQVRALLGGRFEERGWAALSVTLENGGEPVSGYLIAESDAGTTRRFVELPAGSRKAVTLYVRPETFARTVAVAFVDDGGTRLANGEAAVRVLERSSANVAVIGDTAGSLRAQLGARRAGLPEPIALSVADLPERPEPLRGVEAIVWAGDTSGLTEGQRRVLERWVAAGGQLVVVGGAEWQARTGALADLLPVAGLAAVDGVGLAPLATFAGAELPQGVDTLTASVGSLDEEAVLLAGTRDAVLAATVTRGAGRVTWFAMDLAAEAFRGWDGAGPLWARIVADNELASRFAPGPMPDEEAGFLLAQALQALPALEVPPAELLLGVLVAYILLIGPISYVVLNRLDRRELAWISAPLLVIVFTASSYGIGTAMKGADIILNEVAVIRTTDGASAASVSTYAGLYSPTRDSYELVARGDTLFATLATEFGGSTGPTNATEQGDPSRLHGLAVNAFQMQGVRGETTIAYAPALAVDWWVTEDGMSGTVTNTGEGPMEDVAIVTAGGGLLIGRLDAGESRDFTLTRRHLSGGAASEQIYGFAGIDLASEASRRVAARRAVIDTLVGYGGVRGAVIGRSGVDQGPYVIGWRVGETPLALEVADRRIQHFVQSAEVLSGRPRLQAGPVTLPAASLSTTLVSAAGEAGEFEPGFVTVGNGEVVFDVTLPLDAVNLRPTGVTVVVASDPGAVLFDQGNFVSLLPDGYRLSIYDARAEEWVDVGDLGARSRFAIDDPAAVVDTSGRISLRVSGSGIPAEVGQMPVFVSASVTGVIDR